MKIARARGSLFSAPLRTLAWIDGCTFSRPRLRTYLEALVLVVLAGELTYLVSESGYEAVATFGWTSPAAASAAEQSAATVAFLRSFAAERNGRPQSLAADNPGPQFRVIMLDELQAALVCFDRTGPLAQQACHDAGAAALKQQRALHIVRGATTATSLHCSPWAALWAGLTVGMLWCFFAALGRRDYGLPIDPVPPTEAQEWRRWSSPAPPAQPRKSAAVPPPPPRVGHLGGQQSVSNSTLPLDLKAVMSPAKNGPLAVPTLQAAEPTTRVIYHVGKFSWSHDPTVLTSDVLGQLRALRDIWVSARAAGDGRCRVVRIASNPGSRYAKAQVAAHLASLMAECADTRVLLMDADVDAPAQHTLLRLNVPRGSGFSEQLDRFARDGVVGSVTVLRVTESLQALVESRWGTPGLLDSPAFTRVLAQQQLEQDVIVIDGPVLDAWADAKMLHGIGDVIFVISAGTDAQEANRAINAHFERERVLAVLFTGG